ncbi:MAG: metallophosphoesterase family protein [Deltaproteobacteria bacterium]|nr:metallophosphoesterase family protein [Deltaproteobacteria bacterium]
MKIGVISDTHGKLHPGVFEAFSGVDHILHAGDIGDEDILDELKAIAPLTAVAGNIDNFRLGPAREHARVTLGGMKFFLTHILDRPQSPRAEVAALLKKEPADVVIFGHSHLPHDERIGGVWYFNPASAGPRRFDYPCSVGIIERKGTGWVARHVGLDDRSIAVLAAGKHLNQLSRGAPTSTHGMGMYDDE